MERALLTNGAKSQEDRPLPLPLKTSLTHPLQIAEVRPSPASGLIGITFCPGKCQLSAFSGHWQRNLAIDLDVIRNWGAAAVVSLLEPHEISRLEVDLLGTEVSARHMAWYHLPIRDVSIPRAEFEASWAAVGEQLRALLRCGFNVLVHCKGGLGRAGTIAARLMVELGCEAQSAIATVRQARPGAIETEAQRGHVLDAACKPEPQPDTSTAAIRDRAVGALLGLAAGDALGTTLEFRARDSYLPLTDMVGGGPFDLRAGQWTDDTAMALALGESLRACGSLDERDLMTRFVQWYEDGTYSCTGSCFDIGMTTRQALLRFQKNGNPIAGSSDPRSAGNGSLMRLAPVAICYHRDRAALRDAAARQSRTTHAASEAVDACVAFAQLLADAIEGEPKSVVLRARDVVAAPATARILAGNWRAKPRHHVASSGYVGDSLEAALWCTGRTPDFAEAVLLAANLGADADTTAAITGQLAGALYGTSAIPGRWLNKLAWRGSIAKLAGDLFDAELAR